MLVVLVAAVVVPFQPVEDLLVIQELVVVAVVEPSAMVVLMEELELL